VGEALELDADAGVDQVMAVAMDVAPQRGDAVDVGVPVGVVERRALGALDDQGRLLRPALLLRERVPEEVTVRCSELGRIHGGSVELRSDRNGQWPVLSSQY
jgi:hypothetical protein